LSASAFILLKYQPSIHHPAAKSEADTVVVISVCKTYESRLEGDSSFALRVLRNHQVNNPPIIPPKTVASPRGVNVTVFINSPSRFSKPPIKIRFADIAAAHHAVAVEIIG
jgi:hypothetical protein